MIDKNTKNIGSMEVIGHGICDDIPAFSRYLNSDHFFLLKGNIFFKKNAGSLFDAAGRQIYDPRIDHALRDIDNISPDLDVISLKNLNGIHTYDSGVLLSSTWDGSFFHFLFDVLGKIVNLEYFGYDPRDLNLFFNTKHKFQEQIFELLDLKVIPFDVDKDIQIFDSLVPSYLSTHTGQVPLNTINYLRNKFNKFMVPAGSLNKRIFMSRKGALNGRSLINEDEIFSKVFSEHGFEKVVMDELPFIEQIKLISEASYISGVHGGAFSLAIFANPLAKIFEIHSPHYFNPCFRHLALNSQLQYSCINGKSNYFMRTDDWNKPFMVEADEISSCITPSLN